MISELDRTPKALRLHIGVFGAANAGKSTLVNLVSGQDVSLTSEIAGTTTDPVFKPMELLPLGPVVLIDTAGLDDKTELGELRMKKSLEQLESCDAAIFVVSSAETDYERIRADIAKISTEKIPLILIVNELDGTPCSLDFSDFAPKPLCINLHDKASAEKIKSELVALLADKTEEPVLTGNLVSRGDVVLLVAPQDIQAPKGRLILPEVQVTRDLLDNGCIVMTATADNLESALKSLSSPPSLVITDSQIFRRVNEIIPREIRLTSFSLLMAKIKGDISSLIDGARVIDSLSDGNRVAIIESCAHHAMDGDIARVKIPALLRKYTGKKLEIMNYSGQNIPDDLSGFALAIHCGGCMVNRMAFLSKQKRFEDMGIPMTNFGIAIAHMNGILDRICF